MKRVGGLFLGLIFATSGFAQGPNFLCVSEDRVKEVRIVDGPWKKVAKVYHEGSIYQVLKCRENNLGFLYYCQDDAEIPRTFTVDYDEMSGQYRGREEIRDFRCQRGRETAE